MARREKLEKVVQGAESEHGAMEVPDDMKGEAKRQSRKIVGALENPSRKSKEEARQTLKDLQKKDAALLEVAKEMPDLEAAINIQRANTAEQIGRLNAEQGEKDASVRAKRIETRHQVRTELGKIAKNELEAMKANEHMLGYLSPENARVVLPWIQEALPQLKGEILARYSNGEPLPAAMKKEIESAVGRVSTKSLKELREQLKGMGIEGEETLDALVQAKRQKLAPAEAMQALATEWELRNDQIATDPESLRFVAQVAMDEGGLSSSDFARIAGFGMAEREAGDRARIFKPEILPLLAQEKRFAEWEARLREHEKSGRKESFFASQEEKDDYGRLAFMFSHDGYNALTPDSVRNDKKVNEQRDFFQSAGRNANTFRQEAKDVQKFERSIQDAKVQGEVEIQAEREAGLERLEKQQQKLDEKGIEWKKLTAKIDHLISAREKVVNQAWGQALSSVLESPQYGVVNHEHSATETLRDAIAKTEIVATRAEEAARMLAALRQEARTMDKQLPPVLGDLEKFHTLPELDAGKIEEESAAAKALRKTYHAPYGQRGSFDERDPMPRELVVSLDTTLKQLLKSRQAVNVELDAATHKAREQNDTRDKIGVARPKLYKELTGDDFNQRGYNDGQDTITLRSIKKVANENAGWIESAVRKYRALRESYQAILSDMRKELPRVQSEREHAGFLQIGKKKELATRIRELESRITAFEQCSEEEQKSGIYNNLLELRDQFLAVSKERK